jgi:uncharacterized damage-inducible protein DinB
MTMIGPGYAQTMAAYNAEMNRRTYRAAAQLGDADRRRDDGAFWGSIHGTLSHIYWADCLWLSRFGVGSAPDVPIAESDRMVADFDQLRRLRPAMDDEIARWAASLTPADMEGELTWFSGAKGREISKPRALCILQIFNHQTHHRGQVHTLLSRQGAKVGDTDLPFVL